jgi:NADPH:quinone reductase-like Zn-dependent oxidoreductase
MIRSEAWVLRRGQPGESAEGRLELDEITFDDPKPHEALVAPLFGCWEGNMSHALRRRPVDVCRLRCEPQVVLGNAGVVRVVETGRSVRSVQPGDVCTLVPIDQVDEHGYLIKVFGYDAPRTVGLLSKLTKLTEEQMLPISPGSRFSPAQWAACSVRFACAWDNWRVAYACWRSQISEPDARPIVWAWGGGVSFAELLLAKHAGCETAMISSRPQRLRFIADHGITAIDRREFDDLAFEAGRLPRDVDYRRRYLASERAFLAQVRERTNGKRVSIFIDNIGTPVHRATLLALARQGVITTTGWDAAADTSYSRIDECIRRHIHVHTHGARRQEAFEAQEYAEQHGWIAPEPDRIYGWDAIPELARRFTHGEIDSYFPIFSVNPEANGAGPASAP